MEPELQRQLVEWLVDRGGTEVSPFYLPYLPCASPLVLTHSLIAFALCTLVAAGAIVAQLVTLNKSLPPPCFHACP